MYLTKTFDGKAFYIIATRNGMIKRVINHYLKPRDLISHSLQQN